jgi:hypothetical protein
MARKKITNDGEYMMAVISLALLLQGHPNAASIRDHILSITEYVGDVAEMEGKAKALGEL